MISIGIDTISVSSLITFENNSKMSTYSVDSLESIDHNSRIDNASKESHTVNNPQRNDGGSNETVQNCSRDRKTKTLGGRNAIIARRGLANVSRRLESSTTKTKDEGKENEAKGKHESVHRRDGWKKEANERTKKSKDDRLARKPMGFFPKATPLSTKCGFHVEGITDELTIEELTMKADKKLANVLPNSNVRTFKKAEVSYLEVYRRRSCLPRYKRVVRSPEGSTLSIYGDSQREELNTEEESGRISCSSRDDQSELSFYRHLIERSATRLPRTSRSCETVQDRSRLRITANSPKSSDNFPRIRTPFKSSASESKLSNKPKYKPYTIEDYRSLPVPKPDRSLGPDKDEVLAKREWLMRRRSYGDSVSERNRQQIVHTAQSFKSRRIAPRKCFLSPLKHRVTDPKTRVNSSIEKMQNERSCREARKRSTKITKSKKNIPTSSSFPQKQNSTGKMKNEIKSTNHCITVNSSEIFEDSYLDSLRQRHLREKELVDKLIK